MGAQKPSICDRLRPDLQGTGAAERLHRMDFAPSPARGKGGRRADQCGDGWNADGAPTEVDHKTVGLSKKNPITNRVAIPGRPLSLYSGVISPSIKSQSILPASCASSSLMLMIWSSRARNRSPDPLVSCCFGRIAPHRATRGRISAARSGRRSDNGSQLHDEGDRRTCDRRGVFQ
jgi:hypothetical protein